MRKVIFKISINAPREKVWKVLWNDVTYREWTAPFAEGSHAVTDWKEGSKVLFLDPDNNGMVSKIKTNIPNKFMSIEHLGLVKGGVEDTKSEEVHQWAGAMENYTLQGENSTTELGIEVDITDEYMDMFKKIWPKALQKVKKLSEEE